MAPKIKKITCVVKLQIPAGKANPSPPIGTVLGPRGIVIMEFCKNFNAQTQNVEVGTPLPTEITIYTDKSFSFVTKSPPNTFFLKKAAGIEKGSTSTGRGSFVGSVTIDQIREIAIKKMNDLNAYDVDAACSMLIGSARSIGIQVEGSL
ncbi:MAG: 50S ribosomal protein L11 [Holosporales bacterium]|jgi:large subunit ribosomal protein L11|nr:50S ribosomal protein L11 [Holosporales bacterium]